MNTLISFVVDELKKLFYQTKTKILFALSVLIVLAIGIGSFLINSNVGVQMVSPERFPIFVLEILTGFVLPILTIFIGSELLSSEFKDTTIKNLFALPVSKSIIYIGKVLSGAVEIGVYLFIIGISSMTVSVAMSGPQAFGNLGGFIVSYLGVFIYLIMILIIASFVSLLVSSSGLAIVTNLFVWFGIGAVAMFFSNIKQFLPTTFASWYKPVVNGVNMTLALPPILYMISYCVIFMIVGLNIFERKEV